jgi:hypothetical protein
LPAMPCQRPPTHARAGEQALVGRQAEKIHCGDESLNDQAPKLGTASGRTATLGRAHHPLQRQHRRGH